jgi:hypothetical protein
MDRGPNAARHLAGAGLTRLRSRQSDCAATVPARPSMEAAMDEMEQAHHELDRLQGIITRHEGFMFTLRGWLLAIIGGLLAGYYTDNVEMSKPILGTALFLIAVAFLLVESRHVNLVEAVFERVRALEALIVVSRTATAWYDGPKVSKACQNGACRLLPRNGMTFLLHLPFYLVVVLVVVGTTAYLPAKRTSSPSPAAASQSASDISKGFSRERSLDPPRRSRP